MKAQPLKLLIVEDSASNAGLIVRHIQVAGYDVRWERVEQAAGIITAAKLL